MKKILITFGLMLFLTNIAYSNEIKCADFEKFSKKYLKCNADKIKKGAVKKAKEIKQGTSKKTENFKKGAAEKTEKLKQGLKKFTNKAKNNIKKKE